MTVELLTEHHLEFLSLKGGHNCSSESMCTCQNATLLEISCRGSYVAVHELELAINSDLYCLL